MRAEQGLGYFVIGAGITYLFWGSAERAVAAGILSVLGLLAFQEFSK